MSSRPSSPPGLAMPRKSAVEIAAELWPGPDPVDFCKRETIARLLAFDGRLERIRGLRARAFRSLFPELGRLWIHAGDCERALQDLAAELELAAKSVHEAVEFMTSARLENELRFFEGRLYDRIVRGVL